jgi:hypothetical protein
VNLNKLNRQMKTVVGVVLISVRMRQKERKWRDRKMLFFIINFLFIFSRTETFFFSLNNNHLFIECARSIIIKNHYWFLSEFLHLLDRNNNSTNNQTIPFDHLYLILNHISIHCQQAHQFYQKNQKNQNLDQFYQWLKSQIKN